MFLVESQSKRGRTHHDIATTLGDALERASWCLRCWLELDGCGVELAEQIRVCSCNRKPWRRWTSGTHNRMTTTLPSTKLSSRERTAIVNPWTPVTTVVSRSRSFSMGIPITTCS